MPFMSTAPDLTASSVADDWLPPAPLRGDCGGGAKGEGGGGLFLVGCGGNGEGGLPLGEGGGGFFLGGGGGGGRGGGGGGW